MNAHNEQQPTAAQEAVGWQWRWLDTDNTWSEWTDGGSRKEIDARIARWKADGEDHRMQVRPVFAAPVTAVPAVLLKEQAEALGYVMIHRSEYAVLQERASTAMSVRDEAVWFWQGDGYDFPESIGCPVVMPARVLRELLASTPAAPGIDLATVIRNCCEAEQADPDQPDTICINVNDLTAIMQQYVIDASPKGDHFPDATKMVGSPKGGSEAIDHAGAALAHLSNALDDLQYSPDQRPVPLIREAMWHVQQMQASDAEVQPNEPPKNWCPTCDKRPNDPTAVLCPDAFHQQANSHGAGETP